MDSINTNTTPTTAPSASPSSEPTPSSALTIMSAKKAAELCGVHLQTLYEAARQGEIPCRRIGRRYVFVRETLEQWLMDGGRSS